MVAGPEGGPPMTPRDDWSLLVALACGVLMVAMVALVWAGAR